MDAKNRDQKVIEYVDFLIERDTLKYVNEFNDYLNLLGENPYGTTKYLGRKHPTDDCLNFLRTYYNVGIKLDQCQRPDDDYIQWCLKIDKSNESKIKELEEEIAKLRGK